MCEGTPLRGQSVKDCLTHFWTNFRWIQIGSVEEFLWWRRKLWKYEGISRSYKCWFLVPIMGWYSWQSRPANSIFNLSPMYKNQLHAFLS